MASRTTVRHGCGRPRRPITLRHLLTHTSGFVYDIWNPAMARYLETTGTPGIISCANAALSIPLVFDPGERWDYGIGIDWAGKAVEAVSGQRLGAYMQQNLLQPLGMTDTGFKIGARSGSGWPRCITARRRVSSPPTSNCRRSPSSKWAAAASIRLSATICASRA